MKSLYEEINGNYIEIGEVQIPTLVSTDTTYEIDIWGQRHKDYLKENHKLFYYNLLTQGKFNSYLRDVDIRAKNMYENLIKQIAENEGITEQLKATDMLAWVQIMNNISNKAREIVCNEIIYRTN